MKKLAVSMFMIGSLILSGCGGEAGTIEIGGTLNGLDSNSELAIELVAADGVEKQYLSNDGAFIFADKLVEGEAFALSIAQQPEGQMCAITPASGEAEGNNIANIVVLCVTVP